MTKCLSRAAMITAGCFALTATGARAADTGISYEQYDRSFMNAPDTLSGDFTKDVAPGWSADVKADEYPEIPFAIHNPLDDPLGFLKRQKQGMFRRFSFFGTRSRVDDLQSQKSTIADPDNGRVIYLDLAAKTYRIVSGEDAKKLLAPPDPGAVVRQMESALAVDQKGTETIVVSTALHPVHARTIGGVNASGSAFRMTMKTTQFSGRCPHVSTSTRIAVYVDPVRLEPGPQGHELPRKPVDSDLAGCHTHYVFAGPMPQTRQSHLILAATTQSEVSVALMNMSMKITLAMERGNVRDLGPDDASRFEIPAGFVAVPGGEANGTPVAPATAAPAATPSAAPTPGAAAS